MSFFDTSVSLFCYCFKLNKALEIISKDNPADKITAIGGGAKSDVWLQILADIWQKPVQTPTYLEEATSMGAAVCAGCAIGVFESFDVINHFNKPVKLIEPNKGTAKNYERLYNLFNKLYDVIDACY